MQGKSITVGLKLNQAKRLHFHAGHEDTTKEHGACTKTAATTSCQERVADK